MKKSHSIVYKPKIKSKTWDPKIENALFEKWQDEEIFSFDKKSDKPLFSIDTPPPYVNTPIHIGQAYTYVWMDIFARYNRMIDYNVLFPMGLDKNGLPVEVQTEKTFGINMHKTPREEFIEKCRQILVQSGDKSLDVFKKLGLSCNSWILKHQIGGRYETDNAEYRRLTQETFISFFQRGLIYFDEKTTNYCPVCGTTISDAEVEYDEEITELNYVKFKVKETSQEITVATTRPELICSCRTVIFNPDDERYKDLEGKHAVVPIYSYEVEIQSNPYAKPEFGSGLVMICSFGDYSDVRILRELNLDPIYAIDHEGKMNEKAGKYKGLSIQEARASILEDLETKKLLVKTEKISQRRPICWRSKTPIEFVPMKEIYLKQVEFKEKLLEMANQIRFFAPESKQILLDWINAVGIDWVISRRRYYGTEIPLWYCKKCSYVFVPEPCRYYQPWKEDPPIDECPKCGSKEFVGEERTFDTWFDSATSEIYVLGYLWDKSFFEKSFPCSLRPQGKEIVRNWLYFTMLKSHLLFNKAPFRKAWIHMHVVDEQGKKMSKSDGNVIDPQAIIESLGSEAFRIWSSLEGNITNGDIRCSLERIKGTSKILTKIWNLARFISSFPQVSEEYSLTPLDEMILTKLNELIDECKDGYDNMNAFKVATAIRSFTWNVFADHYVEASKSRAYNQGNVFGEMLQRGAWFTLHKCLATILNILSPICPFITEALWLELYSKESIHIQKFKEKEFEFKQDLTKKLDLFIEFNNNIWRYKKDKEMALSQELDLAVYAPIGLKQFNDDLQAMHKIKHLFFGEPKDKKNSIEISKNVFVIN